MGLRTQNAANYSTFGFPECDKMGGRSDGYPDNAMTSSELLLILPWSWNDHVDSRGGCHKMDCKLAMQDR